MLPPTGDPLLAPLARVSLKQDFVKITLDDDRLTAHSSKTLLLLKVKYLFYQMAISNKHVSKLI